MKKLIAAACLCVFFNAHAIAQNQPDIELLSKIDKLLTTFYQNPTQQRMNSLTELLAKNSEQVTTQTRAGLYSAVVMGYASKKFDLAIEQSGELFELAQAVADDNEQYGLVTMLKSNKAINQTRLDTWWYSFFATGDTDYLELILDQTANLFSDDFDGDGKAALIANGSLMDYSVDHDKVAQFCQSKIAANKGTWRESLLRTCIAFNKVKPIAGKKFDRSTPEGAVRLFYLGVLKNDTDLIRSTIYPIELEEFKYLAKPIKGQRGSPNFKQIVAGTKYERLKAGTSWQMPNNGPKFIVEPEMDSDRAVTAFLGPRETSPTPFQILKFYGKWWVQPDNVIVMRKASEKVERRRKTTNRDR